MFQDLTKWKNRRRSTKSDLRRMSQDREHVINQMTNGAVTKIVKNEAQGGPLKRYAHATNVMENPKLTLPNPVATNNLCVWRAGLVTVQYATVTSCNMTHILPSIFSASFYYIGCSSLTCQFPRDQQSPRRHNPAPRPYSTSPPSKILSSDLRPHTRALLARSYATEAPFSPTAPLSPHNSAHTQVGLQFCSVFTSLTLLNPSGCVNFSTVVVKMSTWMISEKDS